MRIQWTNLFHKLRQTGWALLRPSTVGRPAVGITVGMLVRISLHRMVARGLVVDCEDNALERSRKRRVRQHQKLFEVSSNLADTDMESRGKRLKSAIRAVNTVRLRMYLHLPDDFPELRSRSLPVRFSAPRGRRRRTRRDGDGSSSYGGFDPGQTHLQRNISQ